MRIVAGSAKGRPFQGPKTAEIRPTADRVRETLFNVLGQWFGGQQVLDLFTGTGALAFEAVSRGAVKAVLVDSGKEARTLVPANAKALGLEKQIEFLAMDMRRGADLLGKRGAKFDLVFADPPYAARVLPEILDAVLSNRLLAEGATLLIEHDKREDAPETVGEGALERTDQRRFGDTLVSFYRQP